MGETAKTSEEAKVIPAHPGFELLVRFGFKNRKRVFVTESAPIIAWRITGEGVEPITVADGTSTALLEPDEGTYIVSKAIKYPNGKVLDFLGSRASQWDWEVFTDSFVGLFVPRPRKPPARWRSWLRRYFELRR